MSSRTGLRSRARGAASARSLSFCLAASLASFVGCGDDDGDGSDATVDAGSGDASVGEAVRVAFKLQAGDTPVDCSGPVTVGGVEVEAIDLRFYVSEMALVDAEGNETPLVMDQQVQAGTTRAYQGDQVALLDFEDKTNGCSNNDVGTNTEVVGKVAPGTYTGIAFSLGVPEAQNHLNIASATPPLDIMGLWWFWVSGYKFTGIDLKPVEPITQPDGGTSNGAFLVHMGSQGCDGSPAKNDIVCVRPNRARIVLSGFDPAKDAVVLDLNELVSGLTIGQSPDAVPGCMSGDSDPECPTIFENLGMDPDTGKPSATLTQKAFRVAAQ